MNNIELYNDVLNALNKDEGSFNAAARNWIEGVDEAPFEDDEAKELFAKAKNYCAIWRSGAINSRVSKRRMIACVRQIAEKGLHNPYKDVDAGFRLLGVMPENTEETQDNPDELLPVEEPLENSTEEIETPAEIEIVEKSQEVQHVLGVVPEQEEKPHLFNRRKKR